LLGNRKKIAKFLMRLLLAALPSSLLETNAKSPLLENKVEEGESGV
jgi:hypothetical protein